MANILKKQLLYIILSLSCTTCLLAQSEKNAFAKTAELKSKQDFESQNTTYIDRLIDTAKSNIHSDSTIILLKEAYDLSVRIKYSLGESKVLSTYGYYYFEKGETEKAHEYNTRAIEVADKHNLYEQKVRVLNNMGLDYWYQGDDANALRKYLEAQALINENKELSRLLSHLNNNIALLYDNNGDYETALIFYEISIKHSEDNEDENLLASALINMGGIYLDQKNIEEAERLINRSVQIFMKLDNKEWLSNAYASKGSIEIEKKNYQEALKWLKEAEKLCDEIEHNFGYTYVYNGLAEAYMGQENLILAEEYALKGLQISKKINDLKNIKESNLILSKIYDKKGLYNKAYEYQSEYMALFEKSSVEKFKKGLGVLRSKMEFDNEKKVIIEENNKALAKHKQYVYFALSALFIAILFLGLIYRTNKLQKKFTAELSDSNETKDKLFSVIAHDLKGPIGSFYSLMKLYMDKEYSKEEADHLFSKALDNINNISDMLNNLLLWAKTQIQGNIIKKQNININTIVKDNIELLNPLAEKKSIQISNYIPENTFSYSDRDYMDIVLRNLISNAIKFTNTHGEISVNSFIKNNELQIEVSDNGVGMDLETQSKLFEKNNTESTYGTNNEKGTGLGLSLCRDLVESNGGKIGVSSIKDQGTTVYFTIPVKKEYLKVI